MVNVFSVHPTGKFPGQTEILKRYSRFPVGTFQMEIRLPFFTRRKESFGLIRFKYVWCSYRENKFSRLHVNFRVTKVVYHLPQIPRNFGWDVNGKRFFGSSHWEIPGTNRNSEKVLPFSRLERSKWKFVYHFLPEVKKVLVWSDSSMCDVHIENKFSRSGQSEWINSGQDLCDFWS